MRYLVLLIFLSSISYADTANDILSDVYGATRTGCIQTSVTTTGANRSVQLSAGRRYLLYGYNSTGLVGETVRCIIGGSTIDVNSIGGSLVGQIIYANQQLVIKAIEGKDYVSCISATATKNYDLCLLN